jgi:apolipoprotein D and lipocalin family protein
MTRSIFIALLSAVFFYNTPLLAETPPVRSVGELDLARYAGKWYEIAAFPMFFQRNCIGETTAEYAAKEDGELSVTNRCRTENGFDQAVGRAWVPVTNQTAELKVSFFWPFSSDYWVIGLDKAYRWAVVGNPNRKYLWILSRTPKLSKGEIDLALQAAHNEGYDLSPLKYTPQNEGLK